jgi:hypothetical protein
MANVQLLSQYVEEMYQQVKLFNSKGASAKLDVKGVMSYIKEWTKIGDLVSGGSTYRKQTCLKYSASRTSKGEPDKTTVTRTKKLQNDLATYSDLVDKKVESNDSSGLGPGTTYFDAVDKAMLNLVWDFWKQIAGNKAQDAQLQGDIRTWQGLSQDQVQQSKIFAMDQ